jgi:hypothetical protein
MADIEATLLMGSIRTVGMPVALVFGPAGNTEHYANFAQMSVSVMA